MQTLSETLEATLAPHFTAVTLETQREDVTCPRPHTVLGTILYFNLILLGYRVVGG